ncbi:glycosyltransferase family 4 protein [Pseudoalteromonas marina]|nr:glycosyltransferase family 4 protein [Pseudoalteromonas marina]
MKNKIVVTCSAPPDKGSGISTYSKELSISLVALGFEVFYICPITPYSRWFETNDVKPIFFDPEGMPLEQTKLILDNVQAIEGLLGIINNDNIFVQSISPVLNVPFISIVHMNKSAIFESAFVNEGAVDKFVVISNDMYFNVAKRKNVSLHKLNLIYNGVKVTSISKKKNQSLKIIAGGGFSEAKGGENLVKLVKLLRSSELSFSFVSFGKPPTEVVALIGNDERFVFNGKLSREEYLDAVKLGDLFLFPSKLEGCPMAILEAMSFGVVPVAANGVGAMKEIIQHGRDGYIFPIKSWAKSTFELITLLQDDNSQITQISKNAFTKIRDNFSSEINARLIVELIKSVNQQRLNNKKGIVNIYAWHRLPIPFIKSWSLGMIERRLRFKYGILKKLGRLIT